jgi:hypothetical protein
MEAFNQADYLAVEVDTVALEADFQAAMELTMSLVYQDGRTIFDDLNADIIERARTIIAESNSEFSVIAGLLDIYKPFMWYEILSYSIAANSGLKIELGLDNHFIHLAIGRGMEILEVECWREVMESVRLGLSTELISFLIESMLDAEAAENQSLELFRTWKKGDEQTLIEYTKSDSGAMPAHLNAEWDNTLLTQRDIGMAAAVVEYFEAGKNVFYVVGIAHLVGEASVVDLLRQKGYSVEIVPIS